MLPSSSSRLMDVACPIPSPSPFQRTLHYQSGLARVSPDDSQDDEEGDRKSRVRKMGVFLAGTAAAAAASYSYGEIRKRSLMEDKAPSVDDLSRACQDSVVTASSRLRFPPTVRAATTFSGEPPPSASPKDPKEGAGGNSGGKGKASRLYFRTVFRWPLGLWSTPRQCCRRSQIFRAIRRFFQCRRA